MNIYHLSIEPAGEPIILFPAYSDGKPIAKQLSLLAIETSEEKRKIQLNYSGPLNIVSFRGLAKFSPKLEKVVDELGKTDGLETLELTESGEPVLLFRKKESGEPDYYKPFSLISLGNLRSNSNKTFKVNYIGNLAVVNYDSLLDLPIEIASRVVRSFEGLNRVLRYRKIRKAA